MAEKVFKFLSSLKLTVVCLALGCVVVFVGTLAQVQIGIYEAQKQYFQSFFIFWSPGDSGFKLPVLPGGYLLGGVLLVNLLAAHARRFTLSRRKVGIFMIHAGLILLLLGQLFTELFQVESAMRLVEGSSKNYSESTRYNELVIIDVSDPDYDTVVAIPENHLKREGNIRHPRLPFVVRVKEFHPNSEPRLVPEGAATVATHGVGRRLRFESLPVTYEMDKRNIPAATIEVLNDNEPLGVWSVSNWVGEEHLIGIVDEWLMERGVRLGSLLEGGAQQFRHEGRTYQMALRPIRYYKPFYIHLDNFTHERYKGTDIPKNFASDIRVLHPGTGEDRAVEIYMNNPFRYWGETYYQGSFDREDDRVSILHVVRNPVWLTPYVSCTLVGLGLTVQFMSHLVGFGARRRKAA